MSSAGGSASPPSEPPRPALGVDVLRRVIDDAPVGIVLSRLDGTYVYASERAFAMLGEPSRSVLGENKDHVFDPAVAARLTALERRLAEQGGHVREIIPVRTAHGLRTVLFDKYRMGGDEADEQLVCTFVQDLTEFRGLEQALVDSQQRLLQVLDDAKIAALRVDRAGMITDLWSGPIEFDYSLAPRDAVGRPISDYFGESADFDGILERALAGEPMVQVVEFFGRWLEIHIGPEGEGPLPEAINAVAIDVTDRISAELELRRTQGVLERLMSQSPVAMVAVQHAHPERPYYVSPNLGPLFGYTPGEYPFTVEWMIDHVHADDRERVAEFLTTITEVHGIPHLIEFRFLHGDGEVHWIRARSEPMFDDDRMQVGVVMFNTDITDEVRAEEERRRLEIQLRRTERLESLGQLAGGLAHDFNNLLVVIANYAQFVDNAVQRQLERDAPFDADAARGILDDLRQIGRATETAAELTRQLLVFGRREPVSHSTFDLGDVVREMQGMLVRTLGEAITPTFRLGDDSLPVSADAGQIQQVVLNLVVNARHAMTGGGALEVTTRRTTVDLDRGVGVLPPGPCAELTVSDTGHGMTDEVRERAFEPFFTTKAPGEGTGLGLATVYAVVTECGGEVELVSAPAMGTTVRIRLPISCSEPVAPSSASDPVDARAGEVVLVVEDQPAVLELTRRVLAGHGYEVHTAPGGDQALAQLDAGLAVDLLLTDVMMPGMLGNELARHVRDRRPGIKVLYMSGYADASVTDDPDSGGVVAKPFTPGQLLARVRDILDA